MDEDLPKKAKKYEIGQDLSLLSIEEIDETVEELQAEIERLGTGLRWPAVPAMALASNLQIEVIGRTRHRADSIYLDRVILCRFIFAYRTVLNRKLRANLSRKWRKHLSWPSFTRASRLAPAPR